MERTINDVLATTHRVDLARQAMAEARREGFLNQEQAARLRQVINRHAYDLARQTRKK